MVKRTNGFLETYAEDIFAGRIVAGHELKTELKKLLRDMASPEFIYDTKEADRRIDFLENCVRLTKAPFYGEPMKLMAWQKAWLSALFGFYMAEDGTQRFKRTLLLLARKNAKSETCSALILAELLLGKQGEDIVCSSNDDNQANILYEATNVMRLMIDPKQVDTWKNQQCTRCLINGSKVFKLSDRTRNKEGRNIDFAVVDEVHEMRDNVVIKSIEQSQSLKPNPKMILITTEGFVNGGFLDEELERARAILNGEDESLSATRYLPWLYTQDSEQEVWNDESSWMKSNPTLGVIKRWDYLREQVDIARRSKADRMFLLAKDFNIKVSDSEAWLTSEMLDYSSTFCKDKIRGKIIVGGVDLAETTDMCSAKALVATPGDPRKYILSMYWIPQAKLERAPDTAAGAKYAEWAKAGLLRITEGNEVDVTVVADWFAELVQKYGVKPYKVGYDQRFAKPFLQRMAEYGLDTEMVYQSRHILSNPMRAVEADIRGGYAMYNENPVDRWCLENTSVQVFDTGHMMPVKIKGQSARRIDGTLSLIMAYEMLRRYRTDVMQMNGVRETINDGRSNEQNGMV